MIQQWLQRQANVKELEDEFAVDGVPFGYCNAEWKALLAKMQPGDELWTFSSPREDWERLTGWEGIALVRGGEVVGLLCTGMN